MGGKRTRDESSLQVRWCGVDEALSLACSDGASDAKTLIGLTFLFREMFSTDQAIALLTITNNRFIADNSTIWTTGAIFIPAAYAGPAIYFTLAQQTWGAFLGLATVSLALSIAWLFISEIHRAFQDEHSERSEALQLILGLTRGEVGNSSHVQRSLLRAILRRARVHTIRRSLALIVVVVWVSIAVGRLIG